MARTEELPGVEGEGVSPKRIKRLDNAIDKWRDIVRDRMELTEQEVKARDNVLAIMHAEGVTKYPYQTADDERKMLVIEGSEKLKLKSVEETPAPEDSQND